MYMEQLRRDPADRFITRDSSHEETKSHSDNKSAESNVRTSLLFIEVFAFSKETKELQDFFF